MAGKEWQANTKPAEQALQANTASGFSARHRPQTNSQQLAGLAANTTAADDVGLPLAVQVSGGSAVVLALKKAAQTYLTSLPHLTPLPVIVPTHSLNLSKTQFSPKLTSFFLFFYFYPLLPHYKSSPNPLYRPCSANLYVS